MAVVLPYLVGVVTAPLVVKIVKPVVQATVKGAIGLSIQAKKLAAEAAGEIQEIATEASAELAATQAGKKADGPAR